MITAVQQQECIVHVSEKILKEKICLLKDQMVNFNKELHKTVDNAEGNFSSAEISFRPGLLLSAGMTSAKKTICSLCLLVCMTWPLLFPLLIYFREGLSFLFWKLLCLAVLYTTALTIWFVNELKETIPKLIFKVLLEIKMRCSNYYEKLANLTLPTLQKTKPNSLFYPSKDSDFDKFHVFNSVVGCILIALLCGAAILITIQKNMDYFPCVMIFLIGCVSGLVIMWLRHEKHPLLPIISPRSDKIPMLPSTTPWCSEGCIKLCCHTATSNFSKVNVPKTPPPSYQEALLSTFSTDCGSTRRSFSL